MKHVMRKVLTSRYLIFSVLAISLYALAGFVVAPRIIQWGAPKYVQKYLHCRAGIGTVRINPFLFTLELERFRLEQTDGLPLLAFDRLFLDLESASLWRWAFVVRELNLDGPEIHLVIESDGSMNFAQLATPAPQNPAAAPSESAPLSFLLENAVIQGGRVALVDKRQSSPAQFTLQGLDLRVKDLSTISDLPGTYHLAAATEGEESLQGEGELALFPLRSQGTLTLNGIRVASLWAFVSDMTNLEEPAGRFTVSTGYHFSAAHTPVQMALAGLRLSSSDLGLKLVNADAPFIQLKKMELSVPSCDLTGKVVHVGQLLLEDGALDARISDAGVLNLQQLLRDLSPEQPPTHKNPAPSPPTAPFKVQVDAVDLKNIALRLDERSRKTPLTAEIAGVDLRLRAGLELGAAADNIAVQGLSGELKGIRLQAETSQEPLFAAEKLRVEDGSCDMGAHRLTFGRIAMGQGQLAVGWDAKGALNWQQLLLPKAPVDKATPAAPGPDAGSGWSFLVKSFELDDFKSELSDLTTHSAKPVLSLKGLGVRMSDIDGTSPMDFTVQFHLEQGGRATVKGIINPVIPSVEADLQLKEMVLTPFQPYLDPYVTLKLQSAATSSEGHLRYGMAGDKEKGSYEGSFSLDKLILMEAGVKKPYLSWDTLKIPRFRLSVEPNRLDVSELIIVKPTGELIIEKDQRMNIVRVLKNQPEKIQPAASTQVVEEVIQAVGKEDELAYSISKVEVKKGDLVFADLSLRPGFKTRIHDLKGTVMGFSSEKKAQSRVQMDGNVDKYGTAKIRGVIRLGDFKRATDITMIFRNLEMKNLSPYSGKFAGRLIQSGKISADLRYTIEDSRMIGENKIVIDNLLLGEQVDNPDVTSLPLNLAIALLKDANGRIDIGLPVTGDLNDPQFSIGPLLWKMFTNLIVKTVAAPFQALGGLLGGSSETFDAVAFDPGSALLLPPEQEKLLKLADALKSRPQLNLVIQGRYSPDLDGVEFQQRAVRRTVKRALGTKTDPAESPEPLDFGDSRTQDVLEKLYKERFGKAALDELEKGLETGTIKPRRSAQDRQGKSSEAGSFARMADSIQLYKIIPGGKSHDQAVGWAEELYLRLAEDEKIDEKLFIKLADDRAGSVASHLEAEAQIPEDRLNRAASEPISDAEQPSVKLSLEAR